MNKKSTLKQKDGNFLINMNAWRALFTHLNALYGRSTNEAQLNAIYDEIKDFEPEVVDKMLTKWARTQPKMPSTAEIIYFCCVEESLLRKDRGFAFQLKSNFEEHEEKKAIKEFHEDPRNMMAKLYNMILIDRECRSKHDFFVLEALKGNTDQFDMTKNLDPEYKLMRKAINDEVTFHRKRLGANLIPLLKERLKYTNMDEAAKAWSRAKRGEDWRDHDFNSIPE
jgi:hypothetical protein